MPTNSTIDQVKGRAKEAVGALTDDDRLRKEGKVDQFAGKAKDAAGNLVDKAKDMAGKAKDAAGNLVDKVKDTVEDLGHKKDRARD